MNEQEFLDKWHTEKPIYETWGSSIVDEIKKQLTSQKVDIDSFLKVPAKHRLKADNSLIDKAFNRNKGYENPYDDIEDKVGVRFIVLLIEDIQAICNIIKNSNLWVYDECKNFEQDREDNPLAFDYQSVHYILRPKRKIKQKEITIPKNTPCEVQVRTLLQHAHAELTHDKIYKATKKVKPSIYRTVAKSMALIETTDDFFKSVSIELNNSNFKEHRVKEKLDSLYLALTGTPPIYEKSSSIIWDSYEYLINDQLIDKIERLYKKKSELIHLIKSQSPNNSLYRQSVILFILYLLFKKSKDADREWPLSRKSLEEIASISGAGLPQD